MSSRKWTFRRLGDDDLEVLHRWLNEPGVVRFWDGDDVSWPAVVSQCGSSELRSSLATDHPEFVYDIAEADFDRLHTEQFLGMIDDRAAGWIQCYAVDDYDDESETRAWLDLGFDTTGAGIDYLIGEPTLRGTGLGSSMIEAFVHDVVFGRHPHWTQVGASPVRENPASCRALEKAGLTLLGSFDDPDSGPCDLFVKPRPSSTT